jgi:alpha/beta hydrolase family protein
MNRVYLLLLVVFVAALSLLSCDDDNDNHRTSGGNYLPIGNPLVENPPDIGEPFLWVANFDLTQVGYQEQEFFISGTANAFTNLNELRSDGLWEVEAGETADYVTRVVVLQPIDQSDFSGTVLVEWFNSVGGVDRAPIWITGHTGIIREGHALVGVSAQSAGIEGEEGTPSPLSLKAVNPERYASLMHPGDSFSFDIFSQVGEAIRDPQAINILEGLPIKQIIAVASATSATRFVTYVNAIHPAYNPYDGYLLRGRLGGGAPLAEPPQEPILTPEVVTIRTDLNVPVLTLQSESDVFIFGAVDDRQDDTDKFRLWEIAGTSHTNAYTIVNGINDIGTDPVFFVLKEEDEGCDRAVNSAPSSWMLNTAISTLASWSLNGLLPPTAERLATTDDQSTFQYDVYGNVLGGVRNPYVDAPAAILSGERQNGPGTCYYRGTTELFNASEMASMYVDKLGYIRAVSAAADEAVNKGFLLPADADRIKEASSLQWDGLEK